MTQPRVVFYAGYESYPLLGFGEDCPTTPSYKTPPQISADPPSRRWCRYGNDLGRLRGVSLRKEARDFIREEKHVAFVTSWSDVLPEDAHSTCAKSAAIVSVTVGDALVR